MRREALLVWAFIREFLLVRAFIKESVHISNYYFLVGTFITRTFTRGCVLGGRLFEKAFNWMGHLFNQI